MRPTKAKTARSLGTAKDSEDISADLELDLDPWDDDVISSFRSASPLRSARTTNICSTVPAARDNPIRSGRR